MLPKPRLLYILHQYDHLGGVELQTKLLADRMSQWFDVGVAWMDRPGKCIVLRRLGAAADARWPAEPVTQLPGFDEPVTERALAELLKEFRPEIIHIQNFMFWPLSILEQAVASGARVVVSLYDYFAITPDYSMMGVGDPRETLTAEYSRARFGSDLSELLGRRRELLERGLSRVHRRVVISDYLKRIASAVFPMEFQVIEPGIEPFEAPPKAASDGGIRFGFLGSFIRAKGMLTLTEAFVKVRQRHPNVELNIHGGPAPRGAPPAGVRLLGAYGPGDLPRILGGFDVGIIPSIFAETYCIVLSEMWQAGVPAVVSDIGAMGERVREGIDGRKFPPGDAEALAAAMCWFAENDAWRRWRLPKPRTADDLAADHRAMYWSL